jgi:hypothetical protein
LARLVLIARPRPDLHEPRPHALGRRIDRDATRCLEVYACQDGVARQRGGRLLIVDASVDDTGSQEASVSRDCNSKDEPRPRTCSTIAAVHPCTDVVSLTERRSRSTVLRLRSVLTALSEVR